MARTAKSDIEFRADPDHSVPRRIALFLMVCARQHPKRLMAPKLVAKTALMVPQPSGMDVKRMKASTGRARIILLNEFRRGLVSVPGMGIRATTDDEDLAGTQLEKNARRVVSAAESLDRTRAAVTVSNIKDAGLRRRVEGISKASKLLMGDVIEKLRLPEHKADEK